MNTLKPLYVEHVDKGFFKYTRWNNIELILKTNYLHVQHREVLLHMKRFIRVLKFRCK